MPQALVRALLCIPWEGGSGGHGHDPLCHLQGLLFGYLQAGGECSAWEGAIDPSGAVNLFHAPGGDYKSVLAL